MRMNYKEVFIGFLIGFVTAFFGGFLFLIFFTSYNLFTDFNFILQSGILGKVLKLGAILNLAVFFILLKFNKEFMARGIIVAFIVLTVLAFFI